MRMKRWTRVAALMLLATGLLGGTALAQQASGAVGRADGWLLKPDRVFDARSEQAHRGLGGAGPGARDRGGGAGRPGAGAGRGAGSIDLPGTTLLPGLIDAHSHIFLHPYNETLWNDQVLKEPVPYRTIEAVNTCAPR